MPGRPKTAQKWRLATGIQLWRLNKLGRLKIVDEATRISYAEVDAVLIAELEKLGLPCFPDTKLGKLLAQAKEENGEGRTLTREKALKIAAKLPQNSKRRARRAR
jgi:hypothetical protein